MSKEMIWSTEDIESIAKNLDINYLDFDDYDKILHAQIYNHAKALQRERVKEKEYYTKIGNTSGTID